MPGALTELFGDTVRVQADLSNSTQLRVYIQIGAQYGPVGSIVYCQYSVDGGTTWSALTRSALVSSTGAHVSAWSGVPSAAKYDVLVRAVSKNGSGGYLDIKGVHLQVK